MAPAFPGRRGNTVVRGFAKWLRFSKTVWLLERARKHGIDDTVLGLAYTHLKTYEARRDAGRLPRPAL